MPVSGAFGMGEYARSLAIAHGAAERWPRASIQFILSREAPYAAQSPFPAVLLASSPTFHSAAVIEIMNNWRPDIVIFDNAGRTAQLRAARKIGARVVYISARRRQRNKAFRVRWMRLIDEHWIAYPEFIAGRAAILGAAQAEAVGPSGGSLPGCHSHTRRADRRPCESASGPTISRWCPAGAPGTPGRRRCGRSISAGGARTRGARRRYRVGGTGRHAVGCHGSGARWVWRWICRRVEAQLLGPLPQAELAELMRGARLIIANGGSTLLQSIACGRACVAVPIAGDQAERIGRCVDAGVAVAAPLAADAMVKIAADLWNDGARLDGLAGRAVALGLADGVDVALRAMTALLAT